MAVATQDSLKPGPHPGYVRPTPAEALPAPAATTGVLGWARANLPLADAQPEPRPDEGN